MQRWKYPVFYLGLLLFGYVCMASIGFAKDLKHYLQEGNQAFDAGRYQEGLNAWQAGLELAKERQDFQSQGKFYYNIGLVYRNLGQYDKALENFQQALAIDKKIGDVKGEGADLGYIGTVYMELGQYDKALENYQQALAVNRKIGDAKGEGDNLSNIGLIYWKLGQYDKALENYQQALAVNRKIGDVKGEGDNLNDIGVVYKKLGQYDKTLENYQQALAIRKKIGDVKGEGAGLGNIGNVYTMLGQYDKALENYQQALTIAKKIGDVKGEGGILTNIGAVCDELCQYDKALENYQQALAIRKKIGDVNGECANLTNIGSVYVKLGQYDKALENYQQALAVNRKIGDVKGEGADLNSIGLVYMDLGQYDKALENFQQALAIAKKIGDVNGEHNSIGNIGSGYNELGQYDKALENYKQALAIAKKIGNVEGEAAGLTNIGLVYDRLDQYDKALENYQQALAIAKKIGDVKGEAAGLTNIGLVYRNLGQYDKSLENFQQALAIAKKIGDVKDEGVVLNNIGAVCVELGQHDKSLENSQQALAIAKKIGNVKGECTSLTNIGLVYYRLGQYDKSLENFQQALAIAQKIGDVRDECTNLTNIGSVYMDLGQYDKSEKQLVLAIGKFEAIRGQIKSGDERTSFQSTLMNVYVALATTRLAKQNVSGALEAIERGRAKTFMDLLATRQAGISLTGTPAKVLELEHQLAQLREKQVQMASLPAGAKTRSVPKELDQQISQTDKQRLELIDQLRQANPELGSLMVATAPDIKALTQKLAPGAMLVEYLHPGKKKVAGKAKDELWIFALSANDLHFQSVAVKEKELTSVLNQYAKLLADGASDPAKIQSLSAKLFGWLLSPIQQQISSAKTMIMVPWGPMFKVPLGTLAADGKIPIGVQKNLVVLPSMGVMEFLKQKSASRRERITAFGNPKTALSPLPGAEQEVKQIGSLFPQNKIQIGAQATEYSIKSGYAALGRPDVVHLACHGIFNEKAPQLSYLALTPDQQNDGKLEMHEVFALDWKGVSLVTLSACSSGKGQLGAGDDLVGLMRGFMFAGSPSVLSSLWDVDDEATRTLMTSFYKNYGGGMSKPESLRQAQLAMMKTPKWSHPYYWSAFVLFGDWE